MDRRHGCILDGSQPFRRDALTHDFLSRVFTSRVTKSWIKGSPGDRGAPSDRTNAILTRSVLGKDSVMKRAICAGLFAVLFAPAIAAAQAPKGLGTEEFGMSQRELVQAIEKTEELIARCMAEQGFQYVAADVNTVRAGMAADKSLPGLSEEEFVNRYGFGVTTFYTGLPPQLSAGYNPARVGLGERNVEIFRKLSPADQVA